MAMDDPIQNNDEERPRDVGIRAEWVAVAEVENRTVAEFALNGLKSYDIPAVLDARPGILGTAGLKLRSIRTGKVDMFRIMVPMEYQEEAAEIVKIFLGGGENDIDALDEYRESSDEDE